jgi:hypothetical protein
VKNDDNQTSITVPVQKGLPRNKKGKNQTSITVKATDCRGSNSYNINSKFCSISGRREKQKEKRLFKSLALPPISNSRTSMIIVKRQQSLNTQIN